MVVAQEDCPMTFFNVADFRGRTRNTANNVYLVWTLMTPTMKSVSSFVFASGPLQRLLVWRR